jgi:hypothetical protein
LDLKGLLLAQVRQRPVVRRLKRVDLKKVLQARKRLLRLPENLAKKSLSFHLALHEFLNVHREAKQ